MHGTKIYLSTAGRPLDPDEARISPLDRGFLYGDAVFETLRSAGARPVAWDAHTARLRRSAAGLGFEVPWSDAELRAIADATHAATGNADSVLRIVVTRGGGPLQLDPRQAMDPLLVVIARPLRLADAAAYARGLRARIVAAHKPDAGALDPTLKTSNYLPNLQALRQALAAGDDDAILCTPAGAIAEGATSNVFAVRGGVLCTPPVSEGLLPGITRALVLQHARAAGVPTAEEPLSPAALRAAEEVFLTSSVRGPIAVTTLDGAPVGAGVEGTLTAATRRRWDAYLDDVAAGRQS